MFKKVSLEYSVKSSILETNKSTLNPNSLICSVEWGLLKLLLDKLSHLESFNLFFVICKKKVTSVKSHYCFEIWIVVMLMVVVDKKMIIVAMNLLDDSIFMTKIHFWPVMFPSFCYGLEAAIIFFQDKLVSPTFRQTYW